MSSLASATLESYNRAYPYLMQLHILREVENSYTFVYIPEAEPTESHNSDTLNLDQSFDRPADSDRLHTHRCSMMKKWDWEGRYDMLSPAAEHRSFLLSIRRSILEMCNMRSHIAENWLTLR